MMKNISGAKCESWAHAHTWYALLKLVVVDEEFIFLCGFPGFHHSFSHTNHFTFWTVLTSKNECAK
jgi:hypothetical protein